LLQSNALPPSIELTRHLHKRPKKKEKQYAGGAEPLPTIIREKKALHDEPN
jgi:hypothetical protein